jgi:heptosyltransferase-1
VSPSTPSALQKILVLRLGSMGDIIHSLPAVAALRESMPSAVIGWAVEERWSALLSTKVARTGPRGTEKPLVDHVHLVNTRGWRNRAFSAATWKEIRQSIGGMRSVGYDASIDIQGAMKSAVIGALVRPREKFGFVQPWEDVATMFYDQKVQATGTHIVEQNLSLATAVGAQRPALNPFPIPSDPVAEQWAERELEQRGLQTLAILNPGAGWGSKRWPANRFGEVARGLAAAGIASLLNFGPGEESLAQEVEDASQGAAKRLSTSLAELIALTRRATLFIAGDTGPLHLAAALNAPCVALFGPTDPARNGPYGGRATVLRSPQSPTTHKRSPHLDNGLATITVEQVLAAASQLLGRSLG